MCGIATQGRRLTSARRGEPCPARCCGIPPGVIVRLPGGPVVACLPGTPRECESVWQALAGEIEVKACAPLHACATEVVAIGLDTAAEPLSFRLEPGHDAARVHAGLDDLQGHAPLDR